MFRIQTVSRIFKRTQIRSHLDIVRYQYRIRVRWTLQKIKSPLMIIAEGSLILYWTKIYHHLPHKTQRS